MRALQLIRVGALMSVVALNAATAAPLGNSISYQGQIKMDGVPITDAVDFRFTLWDAAAGGTADSDVLTKTAVPVVNGLFTVALDFGAGAFEGSARFLGIEVRYPAGGGVFVPMGARQPITAAPYALYALNSPSSGGAGGTLDQAYDFGGPGAGRTINADAGAVSINGAGGLTVSGGITSGPVRLNAAGNEFDAQVSRGPLLLAGEPSNVTIGGKFMTGTVGSPIPHWAYLKVGATIHRVTRDSGADLRFSVESSPNALVLTDQMTLTENGRLGIGLSNPAASLHVNDNAELSLASGGSLILGATTGANLAFDGNEIMARNSGAAASLTLNREGGNVGIGTSPAASTRLHVHVPAADGDTALYAVTYGSGRAASFENHQSNTNHAVSIFKNNGPALRISGNVGATNAATDAPLAVIGGSDAGPAGGGFAVFGSTDSINVAIDNNEIMARDNGSLATLHLNHAGGTVAISGGNAGFGLGIGTTAPKQHLHVVGDYYGRGHIYLYAFEGDRASGTAYVQARDDSTTSNIDLRLRTKAGASVVDNLTCKSNGRVGIGTTNPASLLDVAGTARVNVLTIDGGADLSENFDVLAPAELSQAPRETGNTEATSRLDPHVVQPGMVVVIDSEHPGKLRVSTRAYDSAVAGVISGAGGVGTGMVMAHEGTLADGEHPVALTGRVYCMADASQSAIEPGDLLTTSGTPGHAMKANDRERAHGAILGKAMTSLAEGDRGLVLVLVNLQ